MKTHRKPIPGFTGWEVCPDGTVFHTEAGVARRVPTHEGVLTIRSTTQVAVLPMESLLRLVFPTHDLTEDAGESSPVRSLGPVRRRRVG